MVQRCPWGEQPAIYRAYHDSEWGVPLHDDRRLFEFLTLETFQAGLSWLTVLKKRERFREVFADFDPRRVARFGQRQVERLLGDAGIIRNRAKVEAAIANARAFLAIQQQQGSFARYIWGFVDGRPRVNHYETMAQVPAHTPLARQLSKDLKSRGFRFAGPTVIYAHMQATGMVNDHLICCFRHRECVALAAGAASQI
jgi:DNA-3-methyladenine glycosylase I